MSTSKPTAFEIHPGLVLKGRLSAEKDILLTGTFEGELQTYGCLTVASGGVVTGSIEVGALVLEPGNLVDATVKVGTQPRPKSPAAPRPIGASVWKDRFRKLKEFVAFGRK